MDIQENIKAFSEGELKRLKGGHPVTAEANNTVTDIYQRNRDKANDSANKSFPKGSSSVVIMSANSVINDKWNGLAKMYRKVRNGVAALKSRGEKDRAEVLRQQYMQENFLPAVEIVVNSTSPDEVLNSKKVLNLLDSYALLEGSGRGYTASYIRQAYGNQLGNVEGRSDASVRSEMRRLNALLDEGQIRTAFGVANKLKKKIDDGASQADDMDYELISRVVAYFS